MKQAMYQCGKQSIKLPSPVYILASASVVGTKEGEGPLGTMFDMVGTDDLFGCATWEEAESTLQKEAVTLALGKAKMKPEELRYIFAGDLLGQAMATSFGLGSFQVPLFGLFGACSTCGESLSLGAMAVAGGFAKQVISVTSSHFASAEKEFRFPLEYGGQRPPSSTWTVTGSGAFVLSDEKKEGVKAGITGISTGCIVDYGIKDSLNMGCTMAPAAAELICQHFKDFGRNPKDYDQIITGDLGSVGQRALLDLLKEKGYDMEGHHMDCGIEIYDGKAQNTGAGGSGCGCSATVLSAYLLEKIYANEWKRILFIPTGALMSKTSYNEGNTVPGIAHGLVIEAL
ncbi:MAG: stage V sporulation protein AD [Lachnospiraceae bacterium]|nr:stage V sporulation protein AD [Lachnospiraceae bacterium]